MPVATLLLVLWFRFVSAWYLDRSTKDTTGTVHSPTGAACCTATARVRTPCNTAPRVRLILPSAWGSAAS